MANKELKKHIILDLDGTIIDSRNEILKTYCIVFDKIVPDKSPEIDKLNFSLTLHGLFQTVYAENEQDKIVAAKKLFASIYDQSDYLETMLYEGVIDTLHQLKQQGHELYIATNKRLSPTMRILEKKCIKDLFSFIMANEMQPGVTPTKRQMIAELKQLGKFEHGFMVGDAVSDITAGKEENLVTVAINYGYDPPELLATKNPDFSIDHFELLLAIIQNG